MYISKDIADRIRLAAKSSGVVIKDMLTEVNLGENTLHNMNTSMPKADNLAKIADYLGVSVDYLLGRETPEPIRTTRTELTDMLNKLTDAEMEELLNYIRFMLSKRQ